MPTPVSLMASMHVGAGNYGDMVAGVGFVEIHVRRLQGDFPAFGHGITGIHNQIQNHLLHLTGIGFHLAQRFLLSGGQFVMLADQSPEHLFHVGDHDVEIERLGQP